MKYEGEHMFTPLRNNLFVEEVQETQEVNVIQLTDEGSQNMHMVCKVVSVGPMVGVVEAGDIIVVSKYEGTQYDGGYIIQDHTIYGRVTDETN